MNFNLIEGLNEKEIYKLYDNIVEDSSFLSGCVCFNQAGNRYIDFGYLKTTGGCSILKQHNMNSDATCRTMCQNIERNNYSYFAVPYCFCNYYNNTLTTWYGCPD